MTARLLRSIGALPMLGAVVAIVGCGGGGSATAANGGAITKARATAYANAVNLRASDLPEMRITAAERERNPPKSGDAELARCDGAPNPDSMIAAVKSPSFQGVAQGQFEQIRSVVEVMPSASLAAKSLGAVRTARGFECLKRLLPQALVKAATRSPARYGNPRISRLSTVFPGVEDSVAIRIVTTISGGRLGRSQVPVYVDVIGFVQGPAEITLTAFGIPQPVPEEVEQRLAAALESRAAAHTL